MASPRISYRDSTGRASKNALNPRYDVSSIIQSSSLPRGLRHTLAAAYDVARRPIGREILLWPALKGIQMRAQVCERTARYHLRALEKAGVLELVYTANSRIRPGYFRHTATYRLRVDRLTPRQSYEDYKSTLPIAEPKIAEPKRPHSEDSPAPKPVATSSPTPPPAAPPREKTNGNSPKPLTSRDRAKLGKMLEELTQGYTRHAEIGGYGYDLEPSDPRYVAPMEQHEALVEACKRLLLPLESALDALNKAGVPGFTLERGNA